MLQELLAANAVPVPDASFRKIRLPIDGRVSGACPLMRRPALETVRSFSAIELESLPSRRRMAAAPQSTVGGAQRTVWCTRFRSSVLCEDCHRLIPHPVFPVSSLSAR